MANEKRLIDANALLESFGEEPEVWSDTDTEIQARNDWHRYRVIVKCQPIVDAVEVVHGRWRLETDEEEPNGFFKVLVCTACNKTGCGGNYCPNCGAKMDGGNENG